MWDSNSRQWVNPPFDPKDRLNVPSRGHLKAENFRTSVAERERQKRAAESPIDRAGSAKFEEAVRSRDALREVEAGRRPEGLSRESYAALRADPVLRERMSAALDQRIGETKNAAIGRDPNGRPKYQDRGLRDRIRTGSSTEPGIHAGEARPLNDLERLQEGGQAS